MEEEGLRFEHKELFYNPNMRFNRSFSSLAIGAIGDDVSVLDGFAASGVRGLRYKKENDNVSSVTLLDIWRIAPAIIKSNAKMNRLTKVKAMNADFNGYATANQFDFVEVDPFGSPVQFLNNAFYSFRKMKKGYLSVTATDVAVLCGENTRACIKKYGAKNLRNEFTHEVGTRVLLKRILDFAAMHDFSIKPLFSLSDRHYIKIIMRVERSAEAATDELYSLGYLSYCFHCGHRETGKFPSRVCPGCRLDMDYAGPIWLSEIHDKGFLLKMKELNSKRDYADRKEIDKTLDLLIGEVGMPAFYYDMHDLCMRIGKGIPKIDKFIESLRGLGFKACRTHFSDRGVKTDAGLRQLENALGKI